jgi:NitT/TauT family transport system substrate-binding protein
MASISVATPLPMEARRELFDLAVGMRPAVELALGAQRDLEDRPTEKGPAKEGTLSMLKNQVTWGLGIVATMLAIIIGYQNLKPTVINPPPPSITLAENPIPLSATTILAAKGDYFGRYKLKATTVTFSTGRDALNALLSGNAQFVTVAETPVVFAAFADHKLAIVATMAESAKEMQLVVNSDRIHSQADLKGKTVATAFGTNADYFTDAFLQHNGLTRGQLTVLNLKPAEMVDAFARGSIDGYFIWQPFVYEGLHLPNIHATNYSGSDYYTMTFNIVTSQDFLAKHPDEVKNFLHALKDAEDDIRANPAVGEDAVQDASHMSREVLDQLWPNYSFGLKLDDSLLKYLNDEGKWVQGSPGYKGRPIPDLHSVLVPGPLEAIKPGSVSLH